MKNKLTFLLLLASTLPLAAEFKPVSLAEGLQPVYPQELRAKGELGEAKVRVQVDETGAVTDAAVVSASHEAFGAAALEAVRTWKFNPATRDGKPVPQEVVVPLHFKLPFKEAINARVGRELFVDINSLTDKVHGWKDVQKFFPPQGKNARFMEYPESLRGSGISEEITVRIIISPDGLALNPALVDLKNKELAVPAILHVAKMRFQKPKLNEQPIYLEQKIKLVCQEAPPAAK